jgi:alpha-galactosidase
MDLEPIAIAVSVDDVEYRVAVTSFSSLVGLGPLEIRVSETAPSGYVWQLANRGDQPTRVRSVSLVFDVTGVEGRIRMFRNGYQSWSPTGLAIFDVDKDPSVHAQFEMVQAAFHSDQRSASPSELRSEWVTLLADDSSNPPILAGFDGGSEHDGEFRLRRVDGRVELLVSAFLGDASIASGESRRLHRAMIDPSDNDGSSKLEAWADVVGSQGNARVEAPFQVGWCSWYQYFHDVTERDLRGNLTRSEDWPLDLFLLDDGYQSSVGDWLTNNDKFPTTLEVLACEIANRGKTPGLWLAPFLVAPDSQTATDHGDWLIRHLGPESEPVRCWWNPAWDGGEAGFMYGLDTTHPEVIDHLQSVAGQLVSAGFEFLKLDFTFAPSVDGTYFDESRTPAQRVRSGFEAIREGAGSDTYLLGCGVPLANVVGVIDGARIGQDVAPIWRLSASDEIVPGYLDAQPSVQSAYSNVANRLFMHRRLWQNDPDCIMLRTTDTALSPAAAQTWARAVGMSGGMLLVSDDLALLGANESRLLAETIALGREVDLAAANGVTTRPEDVLKLPIPTEMTNSQYRLTVNVSTGTSNLNLNSSEAKA